MRPSLLSSFTLLAITVMAVPAIAGVPNPANSNVDPCVVFCPSGDITFHVTVRDAASNPVANSTVVLDFGTCTGLVVCASVGPGIIWDPAARTMRVISDAAGRAFFTAHAGGVCAGGVNVFADGIPLRTGLTLASPDQNGSLLVNFADVSIETAKTSGPYDPTGDLDCNGVVDNNDVATVQAHYSHGCTGPVGAAPGGWGRLKTIYR
jgi:hypothetical protein